MKCKNLLISIFILIGIIWINPSAIAQSRSKGDPFAKQLDNRLIKVLPSNASSSIRFHKPQKNTVTSQKTTLINSRLYAFSAYEHDGEMFIPVDSIRLFWGADSHDPKLPVLVLDDFLYYPDNSPYIPAPEQPYILKTDSLRYYEQDSGSDLFQLYAKTTASFDDQGYAITLTEMYTMDGINWENDWRTLYTYDSEGNTSSEIEQEWNGAVWTNDQKQTYAHDSQNNMTEFIIYDWEFITSSWDESVKLIIDYTDLNKIDNVIIQFWDNTENSWYNLSRNAMLYTGNNLSQVAYDYWDGSESQWKTTWKTEYTFNANNQWTTSQDLIWDDVNQEWDNDEKQLLAYDDLGNNISIIEQLWESGSWNDNYKEEYTYSSLNLTRVTAFEWNGTELTENARILYSYNDYQQCTEAAVEYWNGGDWTADLYSPQIRLYYEEFEDNTTSIATIIERNEFEIYPNPAADILKVKLNGKEIQQIRIIDITGKTVFESRTGFQASEAKIPVNQLQNGVYILQVTSGNQTGTKSFVVSH